jgi:NAD(P)-dependent dehydrogenase (short-subunit alcohol dehydrogenase family)
MFLLMTYHLAMSISYSKSPYQRFTVAKALAAERCQVILADKNVDAMERLSLEMPLGLSLIVDCNVTDQAQIQNLMVKADDFASSDSENNAATLLVNCAGITRDNWISKLSLADWDDVMDVNLKATFLTCQAFLSQQRLESNLLLDTTNVSIVNVGSIVSEGGNMGQVNYAASKGGVLGLTRSLAKEVATRGFRVNAIVPGFIETPMTQSIPDHVKDHIMPRIPLRRFGQPEEVADLVSFLLSPRSSYITGESIAVCGMTSL